jgi:MtN3 and saliva related transmembrane protein
MALAPILQIRVIVRNRDAGGTSPAWVCILLIGFLLWLAYGIVNGALPLIIANVCAVVTAVALLITMYIYRRRAPAIQAEAEEPA